MPSEFSGAKGLWFSKYIRKILQDQLDLTWNYLFCPYMGSSNCKEASMKNSKKNSSGSVGFRIRIQALSSSNCSRNSLTVPFCSILLNSPIKFNLLLSAPSSLLHISSVKSCHLTVPLLI